jgi:hypothetical protein
MTDNKTFILELSSTNVFPEDQYAAKEYEHLLDEMAVAVRGWVDEKIPTYSAGNGDRKLHIDVEVTISNE